MRTVKEAIEEGLQADNWDKWYRGIRNEFSKYRKSERITNDELSAMLKEIKSATKDKVSRSLPLALESVNRVVRHLNNRLTIEDIGNMKIAREVTLTDTARSPDFFWGDSTKWEPVLRAEGKHEEADWLLAVLAQARSEESMHIEHFNLGRIYDPFKRIDLRRYEGRKKYYDYWEGIAEHYDAEMHHDFLNALKKDISAKQQSTEDTYRVELIKKIELLLKIPAPQTVVTMKPIPMTSLDKPLAVIDAFLGRVSDEKDNVNWSVTEAAKTDDSGKLTGKTVEVGDKPDSEMSSAEKEKEAQEQSRLADEAEELEEFVEDTRISALDPLLHFAVEEGKVKVPFTVNDFHEETLLEGMEDILYVIDPQAWEEFQEFVKELKESVEPEGAAKPFYHLPIKDIETEWEDVKQYRKLTREITKPGSDQWEKFFELLGEILYDVPRRFSIKQRKVKVGFGTGEPSSVGGDAAAATAARNAMERATRISFPQREGVELSMTPTTQTKFEELLNVMTNYYIEPANSEFYYEGKPRYTEIVGFINLVMKSKDHPMSKRYKRIEEGHIDNFGPDDLEPISKFIEMAQNPIQGLKGGIMRLAKEAVSGLDAVLGPDEDNKVFVGETLYQIASYHIDETDVVQFEGESLDYWHEVNEDKPSSALSDIHSFMESTPIKTNLNLRDTTRPIQDSLIIQGLTSEGRGVGGESKERKMYEAVKKLVSLIVELEKSIIDPIAMKLLHAHDMIRKMTGRNLTYARLNTDDPNDVSVVMEKVPVTASEILMIVKSYDSHRNLSLNHGISEDNVYVIKGMFR